MEQLALRYMKTWGISCPWSSPVATLTKLSWWSSSHPAATQRGHQGQHLPGHPETQVIRPVRHQSHSALPSRVCSEPNIIALWTHTLLSLGKTPTALKSLKKNHSKHVSSQESWPGMSSCPCVFFLLFFLRWSALSSISVQDSVFFSAVSFSFYLCFLN